MDSPMPATPAEVGSLSNVQDESQFVGSSSGIFFVHTVKRAFALSTSQAPSGGDDVADFVGQDDSAHPPTSLHSQKNFSNDRTSNVLKDTLGKLPEKHIATELMKSYFRIWHSILPFLHGPTFLHDMEIIYSNGSQRNGQLQSQDMCRLITVQCVLNIAALDSTTTLPAECCISSPVDLLSCLGPVMAKHSKQALQSLLAVQLYMIATMSLQHASTIGGVLLKAIFQAGGHRCASRYSQIPETDRDMRKRIFWCVYALDRYLSQALGHPLVLQDSDIDVCWPGAKEVHGRVGLVDSSEHQQHDEKLVSFISFVGFSQITGQAIELFHKNLDFRNYNRDRILDLTSDVRSWWNSLPLKLQEVGRSSDEPEAGLGSFFSILHQQGLLLINRPFLSLDTKNPEFKSSLQACIGASRSIISSLAAQQERGSTLFWPGFLSVLWQSGLIIAYACELNSYPPSKAFNEIETCLRLLRQMCSKWKSARQCESTLSIMLGDLRRNTSSSASLGSRFAREASLLNHHSSSMQAPLAKRRRTSYSNDNSIQRGNPQEEERSGGPALGVSGLPDFDNYQSQFNQSTYDIDLNDPNQDLFGYLSWETMFQDGGIGGGINDFTFFQ